MVESFILYVLMAAPSATDDHIQNYSVPLGIYQEADDCNDVKEWINKHQINLPRHLWCMPVLITLEGEPV